MSPRSAPEDSAADEAPTAELFHCGWREVDAEGRVVAERPDPLALDDDPAGELPVRGAPGSPLIVGPLARDR